MNTAVDLFCLGSVLSTLNFVVGRVKLPLVALYCPLIILVKYISSFMVIGFTYTFAFIQKCSKFYAEYRLQADAAKDLALHCLQISI